MRKLIFIVPFLIGCAEEIKKSDVILSHDMLNPDQLKDIIHPSVIETTGIKDPMAKYYLFYSSHKSKGGTGLAYSDDLKTWTNYGLVLEGYCAPDAIVEDGVIHLFAHQDNRYTDLFTSHTGLTFKRRGRVLDATKLNLINANYTRTYKVDNSYWMVFLGQERQDTTSLFKFSHPKRAYIAYADKLIENEKAVKFNANPEPIYGESGHIFDPALYFDDKVYLTFQDNDSDNGGGNLKIVPLGSYDSKILKADIKYRGAVIFEDIIFSGTGRRYSEHLISRPL